MATLFSQSDLKKMRAAGPDGQVALLKVFGGPLTWVIFGSELVDGFERIFGIADIGHSVAEWGTVWRHDLETVRIPPFDLPLEKDRHFRGEGKPAEYFFEYFEKHGTLAGC